MTGRGPERSERGPAGAFAILSAGEIAARLLTFAAIVLLTRALDVRGFGVVSFALAVVTYAELLVQFGLGFLGQLEIARRRVPVPDLLAAVVGSRLALVALAGGALIAFSRWAPLPSGAAEVTALFGVILLPRALELDWALLGSRRTAPVAWATVAGEAALVAGIAGFVREPDDLLHVPLVYLASRGIRATITGAAAIRRYGAPRRAPDPRLARRLLGEATPIAAALAFGLLFHPFDLVYVGIVDGAEASGLYGAGYRLPLLLLLVSLAYFKALRPDLGRASLGDFSSIAPLIDASLRVTGAVAVGIATGGIVLAESLLVFLFGPPYAEAAGVLRALLVGFVVGIGARHHRDLLVAFGHQRADLLAVAIAAALNVALDILLVPVWGIVGAAAATAAATVALSALAVRAVRGRIGPVSIGVPSARTLACGVVLAAFLLVVDAPHVLVRVGLGGALYLGLLALTRAVRREDVHHLGRGGRDDPRGAERLDLDRGRGTA